MLTTKRQPDCLFLHKIDRQKLCLCGHDYDVHTCDVKGPCAIDKYAAPAKHCDCKGFTN